MLGDWAIGRCFDGLLALAAIARGVLQSDERVQISLVIEGKIAAQMSGAQGKGMVSRASLFLSQGEPLSQYTE